MILLGSQGAKWPFKTRGNWTFSNIHHLDFNYSAILTGIEHVTLVTNSFLFLKHVQYISIIYFDNLKQVFRVSFFLWFLKT